MPSSETTIRCDLSGASANPDASFDVVSLKNRLPMKLLKLNVGCCGVLGRRVGLQVITVGCTVGLVVILFEVWLLDTDDDKEYLLLSSLASFVSYGSEIEEEEDDDDDGTTPSFTSSWTTSFISTP